MGTNLPKISVVTPSYNQGSYLEQTIQSVLDQDYPNLEYIIMDGGSTDGSVNIIKQYASHLTHWETGPDGGQAAAIDKGFSISTGEILGWLNSDDILLPGCLSAVARKFPSDPETVALTGRLVRINNNDKPVSVVLPRNTGTLRHMLFYGHSLPQMATFWRRCAYEKAGGLDTTMEFSFDFDFFVRLRQIGKIFLIPDYLAAFRLHPSQKSSTLQDKRQAENHLIRERYGCGSFGMISVLRRWLRPMQRIADYVAWLKDRARLEEICEWENKHTAQKK